MIAAILSRLLLLTARHTGRHVKRYAGSATRVRREWRGATL